MKNSLLKYLRRLAFSILLIAVLITGALVVLRYVYGDALKQNLLEALNSRIQREITVENIDLDVFGSFPYASLRLKNLQSHEPHGKTLIKAGQVNVLFNYLDMMKGRYGIERLAIRNAFVNLIHNTDGTVNYQLFKNPEDNKNEEALFNIRLKKVSLTNVELSYLNFPADQEYLFTIKSGNLQGDFSEQEQHFNFYGDVYSTHIRSGKLSFFKGYALQLKLDIGLIDGGKEIQLLQGEVKTSGLSFEVTGGIKVSEKNRELDLKLTCAQGKLKNLMHIIPPGYLEPVADYTMSGDVGFSATFKGSFNGNHLPTMGIDFWLEDGHLGLGKQAINFDNLSLKGSFSNGKNHQESSYDLQMKEIRADFDGGQLSGRLRVDNFQRPRVAVALNSSVDLAQIKYLIPNENLKSIRGAMKINIEFQNNLKDFRKFTLSDFLSSTTSGTLRISDVNFTLKNYLPEFTDFNGFFNFSNKDLLVQTFTGKVGENDFRMKGSFQNILAYAFLPKESVFIDAEFNSRQLNPEHLLVNSSGADTNKQPLMISPRLNFNLKVDIDSFAFRKFSASHLLGNLSLHNRVFKINQSSFHSMGGRVNMTGSLRPFNTNEYRIVSDADVQDVNIKKLFYDFGEFGQKNIQSSNLDGKVRAKLHYESNLAPDLHVDPASVYALSDLVITNGELINYTPLYKLSRFISKDNLSHIRFSEMKNTIEIKDKTVLLPGMDIHSSTLNLSLYGKHQFDNTIDYHVQLLLAELMGNKKSKQTVPDDNFIAEDEVGKTRLFIHMTGNAEDPVIAYDTREVAKKVKSDFQAEKKKLKEIFQQSSDTKANSGKNINDGLLIDKPGKKDFNIEWENPDSSQIEKEKVQQVKTNKKAKPAKQEFIIDWDETKDTIR